MFRNFVLPALAAGAFSATMLSPVQAVANHDGSHSFDVGGYHVCIGVLSCLFHPADPNPRDANNTVDHRTGPIDQDPEVPGASARIFKPTVRDHRTKISVRDHRN